VLFSGGSTVAKEVSKDQRRADVRKMAQETLSRLYEIQPIAKKAIEKAAGYAVFSNFGMKIFLAGGGSGKGIAVNNATRKERTRISIDGPSAVMAAFRGSPWRDDTYVPIIFTGVRRPGNLHSQKRQPHRPTRA
jgi:lipid-binding SYLF domain-containing protein